MSECVFCQIAEGSVATELIYEDEQVVVFKDIKPSAPVHVLIVPRKHIESVGAADDSDAQLLGEMMITAKKVAHSLGIEQFSVRTNTGKMAGQSVWHLHYHVQGGWKESDI